jgi:hypothetical protein
MLSTQRPPPAGPAIELWQTPKVKQLYRKAVDPGPS